MSELTPRMSWPYPSENQDPYYDAFVSMLQAIDASAYASREDRNMLLLGGGTIAFDNTSGILTWSSPFTLFSATTGLLWVIPSGSITLSDGQIFYCQITRNPQNNINQTLTLASKTPSDDNSIVVGIRSGSVVYFRNGTNSNPSGGPTPPAPHVESGNVTFASGGSGEGFDYVTIAFSANFTDISYVTDCSAEGGADVTVSVPTVNVFNKSVSGMQLVPQAQFAGTCSWRAAVGGTSGIGGSGSGIPVVPPYNAELVSVSGVARWRQIEEVEVVFDGSTAQVLAVWPTFATRPFFIAASFPVTDSADVIDVQVVESSITPTTCLLQANVPFTGTVTVTVKEILP